MFCSVKGMSTSIDLESSYTSSRPDSASTSSRIFFSSIFIYLVKLSDLDGPKEAAVE
jgi:hypothetical protein